VISVVVFTTCLVDQLRPDVGAAVFRLLRRHGFQPSRVPGTTCCGQPAWNTGLAGSARRVARLEERLHAPHQLPGVAGIREAVETLGFARFSSGNACGRRGSVRLSVCRAASASEAVGKQDLRWRMTMSQSPGLCLGRQQAPPAG
jgi:Cysteine-rich domain